MMRKNINYSPSLATPRYTTPSPPRSPAVRMVDNLTLPQLNESSLVVIEELETIRGMIEERGRAVEDKEKYLMNEWNLEINEFKELIIKLNLNLFNNSKNELIEIFNKLNLKLNNSFSLINSKFSQLQSLFTRQRVAAPSPYTTICRRH